MAETTSKHANRRVGQTIFIQKSSAGNGRAVRISEDLSSYEIVKSLVAGNTQPVPYSVRLTSIAEDCREAVTRKVARRGSCRQ
jgi:hypothetical protein